MVSSFRAYIAQLHIFTGLGHLHPHLRQRGLLSDSHLGQAMPMACEAVKVAWI